MFDALGMMFDESWQAFARVGNRSLHLYPEPSKIVKNDMICLLTKIYDSDL